MLIQYENKSTTLPELLAPYRKRLRQNSNLQSLEISYCRIKSLANPPKLSLLTVLKVNYCELSSLRGVELFPRLQTLEAKYNRIADIAALKHCDLLVSLNLVGNPVSQDRREFLENVKDTLQTIRKLNGQDIQNYQKLIGPEQSISKRIELSKTLTLMPFSQKSTFQSEQIEDRKKKQQENLKTNAILGQGLRLKKCPLPIFQSQSYFRQPLKQLSQENQGNTFEYNTNNEEIGDGYSGYKGREPIPEYSGKTSIFQRRALFNKRDLNIIDDQLENIDDMPTPQTSPSDFQTIRQSQAIERFSNKKSQRQSVRDYVIECFYSLKHCWQLSRAYRRKLHRFDYKPPANPHNYQIRNNNLMSLDIKMINETAESQWRNKSMR